MNNKFSLLCFLTVFFIFNPLSAQSQSTCVDTDGDGWGWDGEKSCRAQPVTNSGTSNSATCVDSDGDGWGWDGEKTCRAEAATSPAISPANSQTTTASTTCKNSSTDHDKDGWGFENGKSCRVSNSVDQSSTCLDPDGDGYGWNGSKSCVVGGSSSQPVSTFELGTSENPLPEGTHPRCYDQNGDGQETIVFPNSSTHFGCDSSQIKPRCLDQDGDGKGLYWIGSKFYHCTLGTHEFPLPEATHPRCIDWNGDGKTTIPLSSTHFGCDPSQFKCIDRDGDGDGLLSVNLKYYKCITPLDERAYVLPSAADLYHEDLIATCTADVEINSINKYFDQYDDAGDYLWKCAKRCSKVTPSNLTSWERETSSNSSTNFCINGGNKLKVDGVIEVLYRPGKVPSTKASKEGPTNAKGVTPVTTVVSGSPEVNNAVNTRIAELVAQADRGEGISYDTRYEVVGIVSAYHEEVENDPNSTVLEKRASGAAVSQAMLAMNDVYKRSGDYVATELMGLNEEQADFQGFLLGAVGGRQYSRSGGRASNGAVMRANLNFFQMIGGKLAGIVTGSSGDDAPVGTPAGENNPADLNGNGVIDTGLESAMDGGFIPADADEETIDRGEFGGTPTVTNTTRPQGGGADDDNSIAPVVHQPGTHGDKITW